MIVGERLAQTRTGAEGRRLRAGRPLAVASPVMSRYRFALRPKWILSHVFVLAMVAGMIVAGLWQLDRLQQKKDRNAKVADRTSEPVADVASLIGPGDDDAAADLEFRAVEATGTYLVDQEVLVRSRSRDGAPGSWVLTPLQLADGDAVVVNRGWIPNSGQLEDVPAEFAAPEGDVTVTGIVRRTETRGSLGPRDPAEGILTNFARADVARLDEQVPEDLLPIYVQRITQTPTQAGEFPAPVPVPALDEGPHLSYAIQWALFSAGTIIAYVLILRRRAREIEREERRALLDDPDPLDRPRPGDPRLDPVTET